MRELLITAQTRFLGFYGKKTTTANSKVAQAKRKKLNWNISFEFLRKNRGKRSLNSDPKLTLCCVRCPIRAIHNCTLIFTVSRLFFATFFFFATFESRDFFSRLFFATFFCDFCFSRVVMSPICSYFSYKRSSYYVIEYVSPLVVQSSDYVRNIYR